MEKKTIQNKKGIDGGTLKMIAIVTMLIDHIGACVLETGMFGSPDMDQVMAFLQTETGAKWYLLDMVLRMIGRVAFPIFCFLLVEGFLHTRDVKKYALRLLAFAAISEIPFNLAVGGTFLYPGYQNVYFTLFIGLVVLAAYAWFDKKPVWQGLVVVAGCMAAVVLKTDYNMVGVVLILLFYVFRSNKKYQTTVTAILCAVESAAFLGTAALSLIPIRMYNGTRGRQNHKYLFYWFYPVHLVLLVLIRNVFLS